MSETNVESRNISKPDKLAAESYLGLSLEPIIPEEVKALEDLARKEKLLRHFEPAGKLFHNLANWHEGQNESIFRKHAHMLDY